MNRSSIIWSVIIVLAAGLLIVGVAGQNRETQMWQDTSVPCLPDGHEGAGRHYHAQLSVIINGQKQPIPAQIGINNDCMAQVHTHDRSGKIHIETPSRSAQYTIRDFFAVWGKPLQRSGYKRTITANGQLVSPDYTLQNGDSVTVEFATTTQSDGQMAATTGSGTTTSPGDMTYATGTVTGVDFSAIVRDGNGLITLRTDQKRQITIVIPARKMTTCLTSKNIDRVSEIATGTRVSVAGKKQSSDSINPCRDQGHLRILDQLEQ